jgi:hypothetical protein
MLKVTGLWVNEGANGQKYFSGTMGNIRIVIFKNTFKADSSNEPDYILYFDEQKKKEVPKSSSDISDDDIPF